MKIAVLMVDNLAVSVETTNIYPFWSRSFLLINFKDILTHGNYQVMQFFG